MSTVTDDRTPHLNLPLPNLDNFLTEDVPRLREALTAIDTKFGALDILLASDDATLDAVQELVNAIKSDRTTITALTSDKADASTVTALSGTVTTLTSRVTSLENSVEVEESITLTSGQTVVNLTTLTSTAGATVFVEGVRLRASEWTKHPSIVTRFTLGTSYPAGHIVTVVRRQGGV